MQGVTAFLCVAPILGLAVAQDQGAKCIESVVVATSSSEKLAILDQHHRSRLKSAALANDQAMLLKVQAERVRDLESYLTKFGSDQQAARVRMEIGQIALHNDAHRLVARRVLNGFSARLVSPGVGVLAAQLARKLKFEDISQRLKMEVESGARSIGARVRLADLLHHGMNEQGWAEDLEVATEKLVTTSSQKAELMLSLAEVSRPEHGSDRSVYDAALANVFASFPDTVSGMLAKDKLAASRLRAESDPIRFVAIDWRGEPVSLGDYRGKVLLIDFWATWSIACMKKLPSDVAMYRRYHGKGFEMLGISLDHAANRNHLARVIQENHMAWRHVHDGQGWLSQVARQYDVSSMPFNVLIGRDGKVVGTQVQGVQLDAMIQESLAMK